MAQARDNSGLDLVVTVVKQEMMDLAYVLEVEWEGHADR